MNKFYIFTRHANCDGEGFVRYYVIAPTKRTAIKALSAEQFKNLSGSYKKRIMCGFFDGLDIKSYPLLNKTGYIDLYA